MHGSVILLSLLNAVVTAAPFTSSINARQTIYYGVSLSCHLAGPNGTTIGEPIPTELNTLTQLTDASCFEIVFDGIASNIDINDVECRAYKDAAGVVPGSAAFTFASPALLATPNNPVEVASILCYVV